MNTRILVLGTAMLFPLLVAKPAEAQRVQADIRIGGGPIAGRVLIGDRRPIRGIEWISSRDYRRNDWWGSFERNSRLVVVYYDPYEDTYYLDRFSPDLVELRLFERDGRFYRLEEDGYAFPGYIRGYSAPRFDIRLNGRFNDRNYGRNDNRYRVPERPRGERFDNRRDGRDGRFDNRRDDHRDNDRDNRRDNGRDNRRDNGRPSGQDNRRDGGRDTHRDDGRGNHRGRPGA